ncbi:potassium channel family protein [Fulvivirgaceae bacterium BMA10]|uniref:Potassium channel family protein n=1 Tax=Splendidivirga corallicola TaxID=3051826 RepID=A0ABT8KUZ5_9BACT|nr:potassium channel family protein [Fulvivirgaceae bacterium BMA10]
MLRTRIPALFNMFNDNIIKMRNPLLWTIIFYILSSRFVFAFETSDTINVNKLYQLIQEKKNILITNKVIVGDFIFGKINHNPNGRSTINVPIKIYESVFMDDVDFTFSEFQKELNFTRCVFNKKVQLGLRSKAPLPIKPIIHKEIVFDGAIFKDEFIAEGGIVFNGKVSFGIPQWPLIYIGIPVYTEGAVFHKRPKFYGAVFKKSLDFTNSTFLNGVKFEYIHFEDELIMAGCEFNKNTEFNEIRELKRIDLRGVAINGVIDIPWELIEDKFNYDGRFFIEIIKNYKKLEKFTDADEAYYIYRVEKRKKEHSWYSISNLLEMILLDWTCGYGVKPLRAIIASFAIVLVFSFFFMVDGAIKERNNPNSKPNFSDALYFSAITFTTIGYGDWYPTANQYKIWKFKLFKFRTLATIEGMCGWIMLSLFLVSLGKVWIR